MSALKAGAFNFTEIIQGIARGASVISVFTLLLFLLGEGFNPVKLSPREAILAIFFFGIIAGMVIGWWREGVGGAITITSLLAFYSGHFLFSGGFPRGWAFVSLLLPHGLPFAALCSLGLG